MLRSGPNAHQPPLLPATTMASWEFPWDQLEEEKDAQARSPRALCAAGALLPESRQLQPLAFLWGLLLRTGLEQCSSLFSSLGRRNSQRCNCIPTRGLCRLTVVKGTRLEMGGKAV
jgi:hypothetical protein